MCGIAIARLGLTPFEFYQLTPLEFDVALEDYKDTELMRIKSLSDVIRVVAVTVHNSALGRKRSDIIRDPKNFIQFTWERPKIQTVEEMKSFALGLAHMKGVKVTQKGKRVDPFADKLKRTK